MTQPVEALQQTHSQKTSNHSCSVLVNNIMSNTQASLVSRSDNETVFSPQNHACGNNNEDSSSSPNTSHVRVSAEELKRHVDAKQIA
jgi:hypothetical protein